MSDRGVAIAAGAALLAVVIAGFLLVGAMGAAGERAGVRPRIFFGERPPAAARTVEQLQERVPAPLRAFVPLQRDVAVAARDAAGYVLLLLGVAAVVVFARQQAAACYRASLGGWRSILRVGLLGLALVAVVVSAVFLTFVVLIGSLAAAADTGAVIRSGQGVAAGFVQLSVTGLAAGLLVVALVSLVGFTGTAWRLGDALLAVRPLARVGQGAPPALIALGGATLIYLLAQLPGLGPIIGVVALAFGLGSAAAARLGHAGSATA